MRFGCGAAVALLVLCACEENTSPSDLPSQDLESAPASAPEPPATRRETPDLTSIPDGDLDASFLEAFTRASLEYRRPDEFSPIELDDSALAGRTFAFEVGRLGDHTDGFNFFYDTKTNELKLRVRLASSDHFNGREFGPDLRYLPFYYNVTRERDAVGSNAFGATGAIRKSYHERFGVGAASRGESPGIFKKDRYGAYETLEKTLQMSADEARLVTRGITMVVKGELRKDPKYDSVIVCSRDQTTATFDYPYEERWAECALSTRLKLIEITSPSGGQLASWAIK